VKPTILYENKFVIFVVSTPKREGYKRNIMLLLTDGFRQKQISPSSPFAAIIPKIIFI